MHCSVCMTPFLSETPNHTPKQMFARFYEILPAIAKRARMLVVYRHPLIGTAIGIAMWPSFYMGIYMLGGHFFGWFGTGMDLTGGVGVPPVVTRRHDMRHKKTPLTD